MALLAFLSTAEQNNGNGDIKAVFDCLFIFGYCNYVEALHIKIVKSKLFGCPFPLFCFAIATGPLEVLLLGFITLICTNDLHCSFTLFLFIVPPPEEVNSKGTELNNNDKKSL